MYDVGRMALSTYLLQNILGVVVFDPFFFGLSSKIPFSLGSLDLVIGTALIGAILTVLPVACSSSPPSRSRWAWC
jgi:uncharacterized membrane protein YeiB